MDMTSVVLVLSLFTLAAYEILTMEEGRVNDIWKIETCDRRIFIFACILALCIYPAFLAVILVVLCTGCFRNGRYKYIFREATLATDKEMTVSKPPRACQ